MWAILFFVIVCAFVCYKLRLERKKEEKRQVDINSFVAARNKLPDTAKTKTEWVHLRKREITRNEHIPNGEAWAKAFGEANKIWETNDKKRQD